MNDLNLSLQGENGLISDMYTHIKAFKEKLLLFESQLAKSYFIHFKCCEKISQETMDRFPTDFAIEIICNLKSNFQSRFADLDKHALEIRIFQNPFDCDLESVAADLQMEVIEIQSNDTLKYKYKTENLLDFYRCMADDQFPNFKNFARGLISVFGTTYMCEKTFSKLKYVKSKYRSNISDEHLQAILMIGNTKFEPDLNEIMKTKSQLHTSH